VLLEISDLNDEDRATQELLRLLEHAAEKEIITDATVASSLAQSKSLWGLREEISEALSQDGKSIKHDVAVPISSIPNFVEEACRSIAEKFASCRVMAFGHVGDGNIHFNVLARATGSDDYLTALQPQINRVVHDLVAKYDGSISAEHGLGVLRRDEAFRYKSRVELDIMRTIKRSLDPTGIMNPNKVLSN
jgi:D-lactate dehydrogenase (cytochrome)